ncbi:uncharacterized protein KY384_002707 [Bacidia gigantensis]|uniref:uncharacterized protein n=1 Tax=Bacidia gigantensis TaxID=2732470 RepID=UPI001D05126B|nr:uncharacterized protein KY384_002707 [Bacidia gigantensis]KAG8532829.1 hypothetical protein KY384_002707 [Bacidia gigantensis]
MKLPILPERVTYDQLIAKVNNYERIVPSNLQELDNFRVKELPGILHQRQSSGGAFLEKEEATKLLNWKLYVLFLLLASNSDEVIRAITKDAFSAYTANPSDPIKPLESIAKLKGVGPATASLLLSCFDHENIPFFSDEMFRWIHFEDAGVKGWDRKIGYTMKEYKSLLGKVSDLRTKLKDGETIVTALEIEQAATVIFSERMKQPLEESLGNEEEEASKPSSSKKKRTVKHPK